MAPLTCRGGGERRACGRCVRVYQRTRPAACCLPQLLQQALQPTTDDRQHVRASLFPSASHISKQARQQASSERRTVPPVSKSIRSSASPSARWSWASKSNDGFCPTSASCTLTSSPPTGTSAAGVGGARVGGQMQTGWRGQSAAHGAESGPHGSRPAAPLHYAGIALSSQPSLQQQQRQHPSTTNPGASCWAGAAPRAAARPRAPAAAPPALPAPP